MSHALSGVRQHVALRAVLFTGAAIAVVALAAFAGFRASAASDRYEFLIRGNVLEVSHSANTVRIYATHTSPAATSDLAGVPTDITVKGAAFYKWTGGVKKRVTFTKSAQAGDEVVIRGAAKANGQYNASWLVVNDRSFEIVGKLRENDLTTKRLKVLVGTSTYKQSQFVDKEVVVQYANSTIFKSLGKDVDNDDVPASSQKVKVKGKINGSVWEVTHVWDNV